MPFHLFQTHCLINVCKYEFVSLIAGGRFEVDEMSGEVRTVGSEPFMLDQEYVLYVKAEDLNGIKNHGREQSTGEERLSIIGGKRPPQFFMQSYNATIPENKRKDSVYVLFIFIFCFF